MGKMEFDKLEYQLTSTLARFHFEYLIYLADLSASFGLLSTKSPKQQKEQKERSEKFLVANLRYMLVTLARHPGYVKRVGLTKKEYQHFLDNPGHLKPEEIERIQEALGKIRSFKEEIREKLSATDEEFIKKEIKKSKQKRFNIRDHWLPLK